MSWVQDESASLGRWSQVQILHALHKDPVALSSALRLYPEIDAWAADRPVITDGWLERLSLDVYPEASALLPPPQPAQEPYTFLGRLGATVGSPASEAGDAMWDLEMALGARGWPLHGLLHYGLLISEALRPLDTLTSADLVGLTTEGLFVPKRPERRSSAWSGRKEPSRLASDVPRDLWKMSTEAPMGHARHAAVHLALAALLKDWEPGRLSLLHAHTRDGAMRLAHDHAHAEGGDRALRYILHALGGDPAALHLALAPDGHPDTPTLLGGASEVQNRVLTTLWQTAVDPAWRAQHVVTSVFMYANMLKGVTKPPESAWPLLTQLLYG